MDRQEKKELHKQAADFVNRGKYEKAREIYDLIESENESPHVSRAVPVKKRNAKEQRAKDLADKVSDIIDREMKKNHISNRKLGLELGYAPSTIGNIRSRSVNTVTFQLVVDMAHYFKLSLDEFL